MKLRDMPQWAKNALAPFYDVDGREGDFEWQQDDPKRFSRSAGIAYPSDAMHYFVVDRLTPEKGWVEQEGTHWVLATAFSNARKKAYYDQTPYRVREVVWDG